ncbi:MAG: hypothetical protein QXM58_02505 [Candidatus Micrarchaeaceae archaeon]
MPSVAYESARTYAANIKFVLAFSIAFVIAFAIPLVAPLPTYSSAGALFLRSASVFLNMNAVSIATIVIAVFVSLLFISFAFVAINLIVKSKHTYKKTPASVLQNIEKYMGKVFIILIIYTFAMIIANIAAFPFGASAVATAVVGFVGYIFIFYAPSAIVVENKRIGLALRDSVKLVIEAPKYFVIWLFLFAIIISVLDLIVTAAFGAAYSGYIMLAINALFVLPYFVIFQAEAYMKKFPILRH